MAAQWGVIDALLALDGARLSVSCAGASEGVDGLKGDGWSLLLKSGWALVPGTRTGDWTIKSQD